MPLCDRCKHLALGEGKPPLERLKGLPLTPWTPPCGLEWGETCDECGNTAEVTIE